MVKSVLFDMLEFHARPVDITTIVREVARFYRIRTDDNSFKQQKSWHHPRAPCCNGIGQGTHHAQPAQNRSEIGGKNHTTVVHATKKVSNFSKLMPASRTISTR